MHLEDQYKEVSKGIKKQTASQSHAQLCAVGAVLISLVQALNSDNDQCVASFESQNSLPTSWAGNLERENSGFSV